MNGVREYLMLAALAVVLLVPHLDRPMPRDREYHPKWQRRNRWTWRRRHRRLLRMGMRP